MKKTFFNFSLIWKLVTIFYVSKKNAKAEEFIDWNPEQELDIKQFSQTYNNLLLNKAKENDPNYWNIIYNLLAKSNYHQTVELLRVHSWRNEEEDQKTEIIKKIMVINEKGII